jgi:hypothetical protein
LLRPLALLAIAALAAGCTVVGIRSGTEEPPFEVVDRLADDIEVRRYGPRLAAETAVPDRPGARKDAFRKLAAYIFGGNRGERRIAMTVPVAIDEGGAETRMRFFLPAELSLATAPAPADAAVALVELPGEFLAVRRFTGATGRREVARETEVLLGALEASGWEATGEPVAYFYDPPWSLPAVRRNEVVVRVERQP